MLEQLKAYEESGMQLRNRWSGFIDNKELKLDDRWEAFLRAPVEWKKEDVCGGVPYETLENLGLDSPYDDLHIDRYGTNKAASDVDTIAYHLGKKYRGSMITHEVIIAMKEEIIAKRLHAWKWDW